MYYHKMIDKDMMSVVRERLNRNPDAVYKRHDIFSLLRISEADVFADKLEILKKKLKQAFTEIRKEKKIYIRQGFSCCGSCGSYELANLCKKTGKNGYMFYSRQSKESLEKYGEVYFNFSYGNTDDESISFMGYVVNILKKHKVNIIWDGSIHTALKVMVA